MEGCVRGEGKEVGGGDGVFRRGGVVVGLGLGLGHGGWWSVK